MNLKTLNKEDIIDSEYNIDFINLAELLDRIMKEANSYKVGINYHILKRQVESKSVDIEIFFRFFKDFEKLESLEELFDYTTLRKQDLRDYLKSQPREEPIKEKILSFIDTTNYYKTYADIDKLLE